MNATFMDGFSSVDSAEHDGHGHNSKMNSHGHNSKMGALFNEMRFCMLKYFQKSIFVTTTISMLLAIYFLFFSKVQSQNGDSNQQLELIRLTD